MGCCYYDNRGVSALNQLVNDILLQTGHPPLFFRFALDAFPDIGSVGRIEKKILKKNQEKSQNKRPCYPRTTIKVNIPLFGLTKYTIYCKKKMFLFLFLFFCTLLLRSFFRLKELFQVKNSLTTSLLLVVVVVFLKMLNIWVGRTTLNGEKKEDGHSIM